MQVILTSIAYITTPTWFVAAVDKLNCSFDELQQVCQL